MSRHYRIVPAEDGTADVVPAPSGCSAGLRGVGIVVFSVAAVMSLVHGEFATFGVSLILLALCIPRRTRRR